MLADDVISASSHGVSMPEPLLLRDRELDVELFTLREGVLSAAGHDLRLRASTATLQVSPDTRSVELRIDVGSIRVVCARAHEHDTPHALSESDRRKIEAAMRDEVLHASKHREVVFTGTFAPSGEGVALTGNLVIAGASQPITATARRDGDRWRVTHSIDQPAWGIRPYTALLGALRVRRDVRVEVSVAAARLDGSV